MIDHVDKPCNDLKPIHPHLSQTHMNLLISFMEHEMWIYKEAPGPFL